MISINKIDPSEWHVRFDGILTYVIIYSSVFRDLTVYSDSNGAFSTTLTVYSDSRDNFNTNLFEKTIVGGLDACTDKVIHDFYKEFRINEL